jgi:hypothetical protein
MKPIVSGNLEVALVLIGYAIICLTIMRVLFRKEWKKAKR